MGFRDCRCGRNGGADHVASRRHPILISGQCDDGQLEARLLGGMTGAPIPIGSKTFVDAVGNQVAVIIDKAGFNIRRDAVPIPVHLGRNLVFWRSEPADDALADGARKWLDIVGR